MGKHFGELAFVRGLIYYKISGHEQNIFYGALKHGVPNLWTRFRSRAWTYVPVFATGYGIYWTVEELYRLKQRKDPKDFLAEKPNPPPEIPDEPDDDSCKPKD